MNSSSCECCRAELTLNENDMLQYEDRIEEMAVFCDEDDCNGEAVLQGTWKDCMYELKHLGWKVLSKDGEFIHSCPKHRVDFVD